MGFEANRRRLLQGAFAGLSFSGLGVSAARAAKASPGSVGYRLGEISANGWRRIWKA